MDNFELAMKFILPHEGGYVNDPADPGGETNYGIAKRSHPSVDIKNLTVETASSIYHKEYWDAWQLGLEPLPMCVVLMDAHVQHGSPAVARFLAALKEPHDWKGLIEQRCIYYLELINKKPTLVKFKNGWLNRLNDLSKYCDIILPSN